YKNEIKTLLVCVVEQFGLLPHVNVYGAQLSSEACRELGFSSNLLCSSCNLLGQFNLNQLDPFCRQCCHEEAQLETRKLYAGAVLEVSFVRSDKPKLFRGLQHRISCTALSSSSFFEDLV
uniref:Selenoprotein F n=1 Tax=Anser cygnoides TaxID=8845 RepID=A0A8B9EUC8_ANSCY